MTTVHLICGFIAAGKTTFAKHLAETCGGVRFSTDEWMISLYGHHMSRNDFEDRLVRCKTLIWEISKNLLALEIDVILDFGFWKREERTRYRDLAYQENADCKLYFLEGEFDQLRQRVKSRNAMLLPGQFEITDKMFEEFVPVFQPPAEEERAIRV